MATPAPEPRPADRLLTPRGGLVLALILSLVGFWLPLISLIR